MTRGIDTKVGLCQVLLNSAGELDTDKFVSKVTETVDTIPNATVIAAYGAAGLLALSIVDGIINLPLLNILIGGPVQAVGALTALALAARYLKARTQEGPLPSLPASQKRLVDLSRASQIS